LEKSVGGGYVGVNKDFYYGVTTSLMKFGIDENKKRRANQALDDFVSDDDKSEYVNFTDVKYFIIRRGLNFVNTWKKCFKF